MHIDKALFSTIFILITFIKLTGQDSEEMHPGIPDSTNNPEIISIYTIINESAIKTNITEPALNIGLSVSEYLQGKYPGVNVISPSGEPGKDAQIIIQGLNVTGNNQPLIIIDGIPHNKSENFFNYYNTYSEDINPLIPVELNDIQSIKIIKNPYSTVLYGTEGVDGAIVIQTKNGGPKKLQVDYAYNYGIHFKPEYPSMLNGEEYTMLQLEEYHNAPGIFEIPQAIAHDRDWDDFYNYSANTDWLAAVTQNGYSSDHYLSLHGKNKNISYFSSVDYKNQTGQLINTGYKSFSNRSKININISNRLTLGMNLFYISNAYDGNYILKDESGNNRNILEMAFIKSPNMSIWEYTPEGVLTGDYYLPLLNYQGAAEYYYNPIAVSHLGDSKTNLDEIYSTIFLNYNTKNWFQFRQLLTFNNISTNSNSIVPNAAITSDISYDQKINNYNLDFKINNYRSETQLLFNAPFLNKELNDLSGSLIWISELRSYSGIRIGNIFSHGIYIPNHTKHSAALSINYTFKERYFLNFSTILDSFSKNSNDRDWNSHYGVLMGWEVTGEPFLKEHISTGKITLRAGYSFSDFNYNSAFSYAPQAYSADKEIISANIGLSLNLINDNLTIETDYFQRSMSEMNFYRNEFSTRISGLETHLNYNIISNKDLAWVINLNIAHNKYSFRDLPENTILGNSLLANGMYSTNPEEGNAPGLIYGLRHLGVYTTDEDAIARDEAGSIIYDDNGQPKQISYKGLYSFTGGDTKYYDSNFDGIIDENDVTLLGNSYPKVNGGFGAIFRVQNISFSINFLFRAGFDIINRIYMDSESLSNQNNQNNNTLNRWRKPGDNNEDMLHRAYLWHPANNLGSDLYVEPGDFIRLNHLGVGYALNSSICKRLHINSLKLNVSAQRPFTFTNYTGLDPELETNFSNFSWIREEEIRSYPARIIRFGIQLGI